MKVHRGIIKLVYLLIAVSLTQTVAFAEGPVKPETVYQDGYNFVMTWKAPASMTPSEREKAIKQLNNDLWAKMSTKRLPKSPSQPPTRVSSSSSTLGGASVTNYVLADENRLYNAGVASELYFDGQAWTNLNGPYRHTISWPTPGGHALQSWGVTSGGWTGTFPQQYPTWTKLQLWFEIINQAGVIWYAPNVDNKQMHSTYWQEQGMYPGYVELLGEKQVIEENWIGFGFDSVWALWSTFDDRNFRMESRVEQYFEIFNFHLPVSAVDSKPLRGGL